MNRISQKKKKTSKIKGFSTSYKLLCTGWRNDDVNNLSVNFATRYNLCSLCIRTFDEILAFDVFITPKFLTCCQSFPPIRTTRLFICLSNILFYATKLTGKKQFLFLFHVATDVCVPFRLVFRLGKNQIIIIKPIRSKGTEKSLFCTNSVKRVFNFKTEPFFYFFRQVKS